MSCEGNRCPTGEGRDETGPSSQYEGRVFQPLHLHLVILQTLLSKTTYNRGIHKAINLEEANRQRKCP